MQLKYVTGFLTPLIPPHWNLLADMKLSESGVILDRKAFLRGVGTSWSSSFQDNAFPYLSRRESAPPHFPEIV